MAGKWRRALDQTKTQIDGALANKADDAHNHDGDYEALGAVATHAATPHGGTWAALAGKPSTFPPETHNHDAAYSALGHAHAGAYEPANANIQAHVASAHAPSNAQKNSDITKAEIEAKLTGEITSHTHPAGVGEGATLDQVYPVGCIYTTTVSTNPATVFGFGTWAAFGAGRVLVGLDSGQTEFDTAEETGGAKTVTLTGAQSGIAQHTHVQNSHNHAQDAHTHTQNSHNHTQDAHTHSVLSQTATTGSAQSYEHGTLDTSSAAAENANPGTGATTATNQAATAVNQNATATNQAATATNQNAGPTDAAQAHSNLQPYIVVYFFKRTA